MESGPHEPRDVVVVGGGIAGLSAAWRLRHRDVLLLEAGDRLGGRFASIDAFVPSPGQLPIARRRPRSSRSLALELAPHVRVNALAPGWVDTPGNQATGRMEDALASVPLGRAATPAEMADLVWFLAGDGRAGYVTGETLTATGGSAFR